MSTPTFVVGGKAEHIIVILVLVSPAVAANPRQSVFASARFSWGGYRILDGAVAQPASVAPVQLSLPRIIQLIKRCHDCVLVSTCPLGVVEIEVVATQTGEVGENDTYMQADRMDDQQVGDKTLILFSYLTQ